MPCVYANVQFRSASFRSSIFCSAAFLNVRNPGRENDGRHSGSKCATSCLSTPSAPARQVMNTNWAASCDINFSNQYNSELICDLPETFTLTANHGEQHPKIRR